MQETSLRGPIEYIKEAVRIYFKKENMVYFVKVMSFVVIFSSVISYLIGYLYPSGSYQNSEDVAGIITYVVLTLFSIFLSLWMQTSSYFSVFNMNSNEMEVIKKSIKKILPFWGVSFVLGLIFIFGTLLLIIPGIIFGIWYSFTLFLVFDQNMKLGEAMKTSKLMVKGKMMKVFGRGIVFGFFAFIVNIIVSAIPYAGLIIIGLMSPLFILPSYLMYKDLLLNQDNVSEVKVNPTV